LSGARVKDSTRDAMKRRRFGARRVGRGGRRGGRTVPGAVHLADATASESAGLEASRARVPRACVARREVTARAIGAACHSLAKLPKVFARSVSDVRICRSHVLLKFLHVSGRPVRKSGKNEKGTRRNHGGVFRVPGRLENIRECTILPGRADPLGPKIPRFLGIFGGSGLESETQKKCFLYTPKKQPPRQIRQAAGGCCVHCFVRSTGIGISRARSAQVRPRQKAFPPRARGPTAVRRPPTHPRAGDDAFRRRRRVFFSCHVECVNNERVCISPEAQGRRRRARPVGARAEGARVPRDATSSSPRA
jgi:hypothetical protein